jgi:hypothetical protein
MNRISSSRSATSLRAIAVLVGACMLAAAADLAYASVTTTHAGRTHAGRKHAGPMLAVFRHPDRRVTAHSAVVYAHFPSSAVLAATDGEHELYVWERSSPSAARTGSELCIGDATPMHTGGLAAACGSTATVMERGIVWVSASDLGVNIDMLLPNGVAQIQIGNRDGTAATLSVSNNVAELEDGDIASVSYKLASGATITETIPAAVATKLAAKGP